jgi:hypothetical protein
VANERLDALNEQVAALQELHYLSGAKKMLCRRCEQWTPAYRVGSRFWFWSEYRCWFCKTEFREQNFWQMFRVRLTDADRAMRHPNA